MFFSLFFVSFFFLPPIKSILIIQRLFSSYFYLQFKEMPKEVRKYHLCCTTQPSEHEDLNSLKNVNFASKIYKLNSHEYILEQNQLEVSVLPVVERGSSALLCSQFQFHLPSCIKASLPSKEISWCLMQVKTLFLHCSC